jgi:hypothetical protein
MPAFAITRKIGNSLVLPLQVTEDGEALNLTGKTVVYTLYDTDGTTELLTFTTGNGRLEVTDAAQGLIELTASRADMTVAAGTYLGALRITDAGDADYELELPDDEEGDRWTFINELIPA